ncbi:DNA fragmentation factor subunit beta-like [Branchiostoma lanceolatum]|uniref:DNA fragmentation factor subunit beta-like n=1 Tax=Branchiostoma lanceolatum TaxID=7740 RepID=UPI0034543142
MGSKPFKIRAAEDTQKYGVAAQDLNDLIAKGCKVLKVPIKGCKICLQQDGTVINSREFFQALPPLSVLVFLRKGEKWTGDDFGKMIKSLLEAPEDPVRKQQLQDSLEDMIAKESSPERVHALNLYLQSLPDNIDAETREEDPDWFEGLEKRYKTKSQVMACSAQGRMRGYYSKTKEFISNLEDPITKIILKRALENFRPCLKKNGYHGDYFRRTAKPKKRLCTQAGWFVCHGPYNAKTCQDKHMINPYSSRQKRTAFSTWNLDHRIEKSRTILPSMQQAAVSCPKGKQLNWEYFYELLFTTDNLKLVEISCHKKDAHKGYDCDEKKYYTSK